MGQVPAPRHRALGEKERRPRPAEAGGRLLAEGRWGRGGGGGAQHSRRHRKGPAPSCQFYQRPRAAVPAPRGSCNSQKQKPQRRNFPSGPGRLLGPTPSTGQPGRTARLLGGTTGHCSAATQGLVGCLAPVGGKPNLLGSSWGGGRKTASGSLCPHNLGLGSWTSGGKSMEAPLYSPSFCEKIFSKVTSPRSSRYFCMTLRMLKDRGHGDPELPWHLRGLPVGPSLALLPRTATISSPRVQSWGPRWWAALLLPGRQPPIGPDHRDPRQLVPSPRGSVPNS